MKAVMRLADGTRTVREIADELGAIPATVYAAARRRGILNRIKRKPHGGGMKSQLGRLDRQLKLAEMALVHISRDTDTLNGKIAAQALKAMRAVEAGNAANPR